MTQEPPPGDSPDYRAQPPVYPAQPPAYPGHDQQQPPPAGYGPAGYGWGFERSGALASAIVAVAVTWTALQWLLALTASSSVQTYQNALANGTPTYEIFTTYDFLGLCVGLLTVAALVLTGIWLARARRNADRVAPAQQRRSKIWVWLGWVVPIVSLWFPKQVVDDVWRSTVRVAGPPATGWWWGTWIAAQVLSTLSAEAFSFAGEPREVILDNLVLIELLTALALTIAVVGWFRVVRTISQAQDAMATGGPPPGWGQPGWGQPGGPWAH